MSEVYRWQGMRPSTAGRSIIEDPRWASDSRLIRTAVIGGRDSTIPVYLPQDYAGATAVKNAYQGKIFRCGLLLGGCGWPLQLRRSLSGRVSHFAHRPNGPVCYRYDDSHGDAADHLYLYNGLVFLARRGGSYPNRIRPADIAFRYGRCQSLLMRHERSAVRLQFEDLAEDIWRVEDGELRHSFQNIQWIFSREVTGAVAALKARDGYVLRARAEFRNGTREILVRAETAYSESDWVPLTDCEIGPDAVVTAPQLSGLQPVHLAPLASETAVLRPLTLEEVHGLSEYRVGVELRPVMRELTEAMAADDFHRSAEIRVAHKPLLDRFRDCASLVEEVKQFRVIMRWHVNHPAHPKPGRSVQKKSTERKSHHAEGPRQVSARDDSEVSGTKRQRKMIKQARRLVQDLMVACKAGDIGEAQALCAAHQDTVRFVETKGERELQKSMARVIKWLDKQESNARDRQEHWSTAQTQAEPHRPRTSPRPPAPLDEFTGPMAVELTRFLRSAVVDRRSVTVAETSVALDLDTKLLVPLLVGVENKVPGVGLALAAVFEPSRGNDAWVFDQVAHVLGRPDANRAAALAHAESMYVRPRDLPVVAESTTIDS